MNVDSKDIVLDPLLVDYLRNKKMFGEDLKLWRGVGDSAAILGIRQTILDRNPSDTPKDVHWRADQWFYDKFGYRFRSASIFCTGDRNVAKGYGRDFRIIPIGEWDVCWSPKVVDFYDVMKTKTKHFDDISCVEDILDGLDYRCGGIRDAIHSGCEIMLRCSSYFEHMKDGE